MNLDSPLPAALTVGAGTALFVAGTCFDPAAEIQSLALVVDGDEQPVPAHSMPRLDVLRALGEPRAYRSGFWGLARVAPRPGRERLELELRARLRGGAEAVQSLGAIPLAEPPESVEVAGEPLVAICMATYDPPEELLARQLDSIRAQTHEDWVCVISDDCSRPDRLAVIKALIAGDPRFILSRSPVRQGFYLNFERALALAPPAAQFIALADQDDYWYPEKLEVLLESIGDAQLVYSDARIIGRDGELIAHTYWAQRRNNYTDLFSLLLANSVTGAASLLRRELLAYALPFPPGQFAHYHDHWLGLTALACGELRFVDRPLYNYVQHGTATLGHAAANRVTQLRERLGRLTDDPRERVRVNRVRYFVDVMRLMTFATILEMRCAERMSRGKRRALRRFLTAEHSTASLAYLGARAARELMGRPETLGAEWSLFQALSWRRLLGLTARRPPTARLRLDALPPPDLAPRPGRQPPAARGPVRELAEKIAPIELAISDQASRRVNLLIPTIDLEHFFGGYIAKFNLAARLAERGTRVRLVTVDPVAPLPGDWRQRIETNSGVPGLLDRVEVAFGRGSGPLEVSRQDAFIATTWWTAHIARRAGEELGRPRFLYLIQEYEPFTFPMGSFAALAAESYGFPHYALFSTELLRDYFRRHAIGAHGDDDSLTFENAISPVAAPSESELRARSTRRLLFYARPEPHAARNMFELGVLALQRALGEGMFRGEWQLRGVGTVSRSRRIDLGEGAELELIERRTPADYAQLLREHDVGLALMYTPHPSLVPIEMAAAGICTVTNTFENKTEQALRAISPNLISGEPTVDGVVAALRLAAERVGDAPARTAGSAVSWSRDWATSFPDELLARVESFLES